MRVFLTVRFGINFILFSVNWWAKREKRKGDEIYFIHKICNGRITPILDLWLTRSHLLGGADQIFWNVWICIKWRVQFNVDVFFFSPSNSTNVIQWCMSTLQCRITSRYLIEIWALHQHSKGSFISFISPDRISHEIHKGWNKSPLVICFFSSPKFCICRTQWKNEFNSNELWCEFLQYFSLLPLHLRNIKKNQSNLFKDLKMCNRREKNIRREWEQTEEYNRQRTLNSSINFLELYYIYRCGFVRVLCPLLVTDEHFSCNFLSLSLSSLALAGQSIHLLPLRLFSFLHVNEKFRMQFFGGIFFSAALPQLMPMWTLCVCVLRPLSSWIVFAIISLYLTNLSHSISRASSDMK